MPNMRTLTPLGTDLPADWRLERLGSLCSKIGSGATPRGGAAVYQNHGVAFIRSQNVLDHAFSSDGLAHIDAESADRLRSVSVEPRDVLLNITGDGDTIARCCVVPSDVLPARVNQHVAIVRPRAGVIPEFLQRYLSHPLVREYMLNHNSGGSRRALTKGHIEGFNVVLPPEPEQRAIALLLGSLDNKIAANGRMVRSIQRLTDTYFASAYKELRLAVTLGDLVKSGHLSFGDGYRTKKSEHGQPGLPILRVAEVADFDVLPSYADFVSLEFKRSMAQKTSRAGDVVLTTKGTVGRSTIMPSDLPEFVYSPQVCYFRPAIGQTRISSEYLYLWFRSRGFRSQAASRKGQTDMADYLSLTDISTLRICIPDEVSAKNLQARICSLLARAELCRREDRTLIALRDTLLPKLISGELRVKEAEQLVSSAV